jgi:hypothetical protein
VKAAHKNKQIEKMYRERNTKIIREYGSLGVTMSNNEHQKKYHSGQEKMGAEE